MTQHLTGHKQVLFFIGLAALILGVRLHIIDLLSVYTPYYDDWGMGGLMDYFKSGQDVLHHFILPVNGHLAIWSKTLNIGLFQLNQEQWDPQVLMQINAIIWTITGLFLIKISLSYFSSIRSSVLIFFLIGIFLFPHSLSNALWGIQTHNYLMILLSIVAIWMTTSSPKTLQWYFGLFFAFAAGLTMGGGAFASIAIFGVTCVRFFLQKEDRKFILPTLYTTLLLTIFSLCLLVYSSGDDHAAYTAENLGDAVTTFLKTLSFPLEKEVWPSFIWFLPTIIVGLKATKLSDLNNRMVVFNITLFAFSLMMAVAIGYVRGRDGAPPSAQYYDFLVIFTITSLLSLLILQTKRYSIHNKANAFLVFAWIILFIAGVERHTDHINYRIDEIKQLKPIQRDNLRNYMVTGELSFLEGQPYRHIPFAGGKGLARFVDRLAPNDVLPFEMQIQPELVAQNNNSPFIKNGSIRPSNKEFFVRYRGEPTIGSFDYDNGGSLAVGEFISEPIQTNRSYLMVPVLGYLGYPDLTLKLIEESTGKETIIKPKENNSKYAEVWREIYIEAPKGPFKIVATDNNADLWFGFAAPRTIGKLSMLSKEIARKGKTLWLIGLTIILFVFLNPILNIVRPEK